MKTFIYRKFLPFLYLIRWPNLLVIVLTQFLIRYAIIGRIYEISGAVPAMGNGLFWLLVLVTMMIAAAGYIINDYFDLRTDRVNHPDKMIIGRFFHRRQAIKFHFALNALALAGGLFLGFSVGSWRLGLLFPMMMILLWLYSSRYKRTVLWGNLAVAFLSAMVIVVVWLFEFFILRLEPNQFVNLYNGMQRINMLVMAYALFAFLLSLCREVIKDIEDARGDALTGCHTLPVKYGLQTAKIWALVFGLLTLFLAGFGIWQLFRMHMSLPAIYFVAAVLLPLMFILYRMAVSKNEVDFRLISKLLKVLMLAGIIGLQPLAMAL